MACQVLHKIETYMDEPDAGLWEFRDRSQQHCYTYLFHWAGSSAALKIAYFLKDKRLEEKALRIKNKAATQIEACFNPQRGVYTQAVGSQNLDASTLQLIMMNYLEGDSRRARQHLRMRCCLCM